MQMKRNLSQAKQETLPVWEGFLPIKKNVFFGTAGAGFEPADPGYEPGMYTIASPDGRKGPIGLMEAPLRNGGSQDFRGSRIRTGDTRV